MMFKPVPIHDARPGLRIEQFQCAWWITIGKYVLRIGKPWGHNYRYAWRPLMSFFRCYR